MARLIWEFLWLRLSGGSWGVPRGVPTATTGGAPPASHPLANSGRVLGRVGALVQLLRGLPGGAAAAEALPGPPQRRSGLWGAAGRGPPERSDGCVLEGAGGCVGEGWFMGGCSRVGGFMDGSGATCTGGFVNEWSWGDGWALWVGLTMAGGVGASWVRGSLSG